jgi:hypothetical protein
MAPAPPVTTTTVFMYPSGDPVLPGYPLIVPVGTIDDRVASWFEAYLDGPNSGDCIVRSQFFPNTGGACWEGVQTGSAEP